MGRPPCRVVDQASNKDFKTKFEGALAEAHSTADRTAARMQEISSGVVPLPDTDIPGQLNNAILSLRFKGDLTNNAVKQKVFRKQDKGLQNRSQKLTLNLLEAFDDITGYSEGTVQDQAKIRFYCDIDDKSRMTVVPDIQGVDYSQIGSVLNSQKTDCQEWVDTRNGVRDVGSIRPCHDTVEITYAYTLKGLDLDPKYVTQNPNRAVIVVRNSPGESCSMTR